METLNTIMILGGIIIGLLLLLAPVFIYQCAAYTRRIWTETRQTNKLLREQTEATRELLDEIRAARARAARLRKVS